MKKRKMLEDAREKTAGEEGRKAGRIHQVIFIEDEFQHEILVYILVCVSSGNQT